MEAPIHGPCGTRHWSSQPCPAEVVNKAAPTVAKLKAARKALDASPVPKLDRVAIMPDGKVIVGPKSKPRGRPKVDGPSKGKSGRAEYQRELMRKKRAAEKAKGGTP